MIHLIEIFLPNNYASLGFKFSQKAAKIIDFLPKLLFFAVQINIFAKNQSNMIKTRN